MTIHWLAAHWYVPALGALLAGAVVVLNFAVVRDKYIVEWPLAARGRNVLIAGHVLIALALAALPFGFAWERIDLFVVLMLGGVALFQVGSGLILVERILRRWNVEPWRGPDRRSGDDRRVINEGPAARSKRHGGPAHSNERRGERRGVTTGPMPLDGPLTRMFPDG